MPESLHHLLPRSKNGSNSQLNLLRIDDRLHKAFHRVFENRTPIEQFEYIKNFNAKILTIDVQMDINKILCAMYSDSEYVYRE